MFGEDGRHSNELLESVRGASSLSKNHDDSANSLTRKDESAVLLKFIEQIAPSPSPKKVSAIKSGNAKTESSKKSTKKGSGRVSLKKTNRPSSGGK